MAHFAALEMNGIFYFKFPVFIDNHTYIALLAAHGAIKWGLLYNHGSFLSIRKGLDQFILRGKDRNP